MITSTHSKERIIKDLLSPGILVTPPSFTLIVHLHYDYVSSISTPAPLDCGLPLATQSAIDILRPAIDLLLH